MNAAANTLYSAGRDGVVRQWAISAQVIIAPSVQSLFLALLLRCVCVCVCVREREREREREEHYLHCICLTEMEDKRAKRQSIVKQKEKEHG